MAAHVVNLNDLPNLEASIVRPGQKPALGRKSTRFLGLPDQDFVLPTKPPYAYFIERPAGDVTPDHAHNADRTEFVVEGRIEWREHGKPPVEYGAGTLTFVEAGTTYGYTVLEDAKILILFAKSPGMNYR
ncbi:MAG: cupin domain-containing protein [Deltaproteobacteria bacterium]|nr:cupin domain-containing protein [Deltaproteobacteria bacterium]